MVAFAGYANVLTGAFISCTVTIAEITTDWSDGSSANRCSRMLQKGEQGQFLHSE